MNNTTFHIRAAAIKDKYEDHGNTLQLKSELKQLLKDIERAISMSRKARKNTVELIDLFEFVTDLSNEHE